MSQEPRGVVPETEKEKERRRLQVLEERKRRSLLSELFSRLIKEKPLGVAGGIIVIILVLAAIFANFLAPYGMNEIHLLNCLQPPSAQFLFGTDEVGRDILSRVIYGARISIVVGFGASALNVVISLAIGLISGFAGGKIDILMQRFVDAWMCFPALFVYLSVMSILGPGLLQVTLVLGIATGIRWSRVLRGAVIGVRENVYIEAARAIGASPARIIIKHILPNVMAPTIIIFTVNVGYMILSEATLSFLGFGIPPPAPSWGGMLSGAGRQYMYQAPWMVLWPGAALALVIYGVNMLGDAVRDILDPRLRGGLGRYGGAKVKEQLKRVQEVKEEQPS